MALSLYAHTSWEFQHRSIMICGFREPNDEFTSALDGVMERLTARMAGTFNR